MNGGEGAQHFTRGLYWNCDPTLWLRASVSSLSHIHSSGFLNLHCLSQGRTCSSTIPPKNFQGNSAAANRIIGHQCPVKNAVHSNMVAKAIEVSRGD